MKVVDLDTMSWDGIALQLTAQIGESVLKLLKTGKTKLMPAAADKRAGSNSTRPVASLGCDFCNKDCHSRICIISHKRRCYIPAGN